MHIQVTFRLKNKEEKVCLIEQEDKPLLNFVFSFLLGEVSSFYHYHVGVIQESEIEDVVIKRIEKEGDKIENPIPNIDEASLASMRAAGWAGSIDEL
jgi:hypothetical protein